MSSDTREARAPAARVGLMVATAGLMVVRAQVQVLVKAQVQVQVRVQVQRLQGAPRGMVLEGALWWFRQALGAGTRSWCLAWRGRLSRCMWVCPCWCPLPGAGAGEWAPSPPCLAGAASRAGGA
jgi:hypothetical protein